MAARKILILWLPDFAQRQHPAGALPRQARDQPWKRSDLQAFGDCSQSSQIGPHLVQPLRRRPSAITPIAMQQRRTITHLTGYGAILPGQSGRFQAMPAL
jgi:hypothetical protein